MENKVLTYESPAVEVLEIEVEQGFETSPQIPGVSDYGPNY